MSRFLPPRKCTNLCPRFLTRALICGAKIKAFLTSEIINPFCFGIHLLISSLWKSLFLAPQKLKLVSKNGDKNLCIFGGQKMKHFWEPKPAPKNDTKIAPKNMSAIHSNLLSRSRVLEFLLCGFQIKLADKIAAERN